MTDRAEPAPSEPETPPQGLGATALTAVTLALVGATLLGFLGRWWWPFDLVANLRLHLAVALLLVVVTAAALRVWRWTAVAAIGLALNLLLVVPVVAATQLGSPPPPRDGAATIEVTFFNTKFWADRDETIEYLAARDDDVVVLALAIGHWIDDLQEADLDLHLQAGPRIGTDREIELVVLTRDPDAQVTVNQVTDRSRDAVVEVALSTDDGPIHLLAAYPVSPLTADRADRRDATLGWIEGWAQRRGDAAVVVGDLNATVWSAPLRQLLRDTDLTDSRVGHGMQASWPTRLGPLGIAIDHVLVSGELTTLDRQLGPSFGSDHRMVHTTLTWRDQTAEADAHR